jgi:hypothetical protein
LTHPTPRIAAQEFGDATTVFDVALEAQSDCLDALQQQERRQRRQYGAGGALIDAAAPRDIGGRAEMLGVDQAVVGWVWLVEHAEAARMLPPRKAAGIDDRATQRGAVTAHEFGERMNDHVGAVIDRTQQDRRRHRVVDDQRNSMPPRQRRQLFDVADIARRIADALAKDRARVVVDQLFDGVRTIGFGKADLDALARENVSEQRVRGAVELRDGNDVAAHLGEVEHRIIQRRLTGAHA